MNVLHIINNLGSGGAEKLLVDYLLYSFESIELNHSLYLLSGKSNRFLSNELSAKIPCHISTKKSLYSPLHLIDLYYFIKKNKIDIIHVHLFPAVYYVSLLRPLFPKTIFVFTEHSTNNRRRAYTFLKPLERLIYKRFDKIISISNATKINLESWLGNKFSKKIVVIPNGITIKDPNTVPIIDLRSELKLPRNSILIIMVARFTPYKDHETLLEALQLLPENYVLLLVGEGPTQSKIEHLVLQFELSNRVILLGFREDISSLYRSCDVAVLSSHFEGFGLSAIEAVAMGIPLVISNTPGLTDIVGEIAITVHDNSPYAMAQSIQNAFKSLNNVSEHLLKKYSIMTYSNTLLEMYKTLMKGVI
jgi:glycosyltransferase involved in cell wall biosynthesis